MNLEKRRRINWIADGIICYVKPSSPDYAEPIIVMTWGGISPPHVSKLSHAHHFKNLTASLRFLAELDDVTWNGLMALAYAKTWLDEIAAIIGQPGAPQTGVSLQWDIERTLKVLALRHKVENPMDAERLASSIRHIVPNLRLRWNAELAPFSDEAVARCYEEFGFSEDFGSNDENFPKWFDLLPGYETSSNNDRAS